MEFDRKSLGLLKLKGDDGLRELARKKGIKLKKGAGKEDVITALLRSLPNKDFKQGFNINRAAPPPPPGMTQQQAKVEIKKRLDIMARETYDKNSLLTTQNERTAQIAEYDRIRRATQAFERSEAVREIQEVADRLNAQRNIDIWGEDEDFGEMILSFQEMTDSNTAFFFEGADQSKEGLEIASLYEDEFQYNQIVDEGDGYLKDESMESYNKERAEVLRKTSKTRFKEGLSRMMMGEEDTRSISRAEKQAKAKKLFDFYNLNPNTSAAKYGGNRPQLLAIPPVMNGMRLTDNTATEVRLSISEHEYLFKNDPDRRFQMAMLRGKRGITGVGDGGLKDDDFRQIGLFPEVEAYKLASEAGDDEYEGVIIELMERGIYLKSTSVLPTPMTREEAIEKLRTTKVKKVKRKRNFPFDMFAENRQNVPGIYL